MSENAKTQAQAQMDSIIEMVEALNVDYERLNELRDAREAQQSVISGTMRPADLIPAFIDELESLNETKAAKLRVRIPSAALWNAAHSFWNSEDAAELLEELFDALDYHAEVGLYFGAHPGDGAEFGFWMSEDDAQELAELEAAAGDCESRENAERRILEDALSVEVRSAWRTLQDDPVDTEFRILLCTGGPAVQIRGELNRYGEPERAWIEYQDWGTPWTERANDIGDEMALLEYARCFWFGEGF